jgi:glucose uptake protein GlcU
MASFNIWEFFNQKIDSKKLLNLALAVIGIGVGIIIYGFIWHITMYIGSTFFPNSFYLNLYDTTIWRIGEIFIFAVAVSAGIMVSFQLNVYLEKKKAKKE